MTIPPRFLDEIRSRLTLSDIIGKRIKITRAGREFKACCPFHHEKTPSFTINDDKQFYHCFGCGAHGDVIGFVMQHNNLSFIDAIEMLAAEAGLQVPKPDPEMVKKAERAKGLHELMEAVTRFQETVLYEKPEGQIALKYMNDRGMKPEVMRAFKLGFAPADGQALRTFLKGQGFNDQQMFDAGVIKKSTRGGEPYGFFRDRIMFPVTDRRGRVVAFGGRILPDHLRPPNTGDFVPPKYINSGDTALFDKGRMLYAESLVRQAVHDTGKPPIVTEGYMDVIACHQAGFNTAVAPMGTALTEDQIVSLWSISAQIEDAPVLCFDGDEAGRRAAVRACERVMPLLAPSKSLRFAFLPQGEDPDSLIKNGGAQAFSNVLTSAMSLFDFLWSSHTAGRKFDTPEARAGLSKTLESKINEIADRSVQQHYQSFLRQRISEKFFQRGSSYQQRGGRPDMRRPDARSYGGLRKPAFKPQDVNARIFLACVINHPHIYSQIEEGFGLFKIENPGFQRVREEIIRALEDDDALDTAGLCTHLNDAGLEKETSDILNESVYVHASFCEPATAQEEVYSRLCAWLKELEDRDWSEINQGWKSAFTDLNEQEEERLRQMINVKSSDGTL